MTGVQTCALPIWVLGSPELTANLLVVIKLPRKKPINKTLIPTKGDPLQVFRSTIGAALKRAEEPWAKEQVDALLKGRKAAEIPQEEWGAIIDQLQGPPPKPEPPPEEQPPEDSSDF